METPKKAPELTLEEYEHLLGLAYEAERQLINAYNYLNDITGSLHKRLYATQKTKSRK